MLLDAAREGRIEDVREYLRQGMDVNKTDEVPPPLVISFILFVVWS